MDRIASILQSPPYYRPIQPLRNPNAKAMSQPNKLLFGVLLAFLMTCCTQTAPLSQFDGLEPTFQHFDVPTQSLVLDPINGDTFYLSNGGSIEIPAGALVDANGTTLSETVDLQFREFHNQADILASGIPMRYDSAGTNGHMVTAGMFELRATVASGKEVLISKQTPIQVNLASFEAGTNYNSYCLDDEKGSWNYLETTAPKENLQKAESLSALLASDTLPQPIAPVSYTEGTPVLDLQPNYERLPELKPFHGVVWQHAGQGPNVLEEEWFFKEAWSTVDLERNGADFSYKAQFASADTNITTMLQPVFGQKDFAKAMERFGEREADYSANKELVKAERKRLDQQADLLRSIQVNNFGIYNYDRIYKLKETVHLAANFDWEEKTNTDINEVQVFLIVESANAVVAFPPSNWDLFNFDPSESHKLLAVLPGDRIAYLSASDFNSLRLNKEKHDEQEYTFHLKVAEGAINSVGDLQQFLAQI